jgi:asparagine synthase (glutamine-hydrolysing)
MRFFLCCVRPSGAPVPETVRARYLTATCCRGLDLQQCEVDGLWTLIHSDEAGPGGSVVRWRSLVGVGSVRLDNREELVGWTGAVNPDVSDLDLVVRLLAQQGEQRIRDVLGDFAFVVWDTATRRLVAARDAFGVRPLYYAQQPDLIAFASRAELLASGEQYDLEYLAALAALAYTPRGHTVYAGVRALPDAAEAQLERGMLRVQQYWSPQAFEPRDVPVKRLQDACDEFRDLLLQAVRLRVSDGGTTWSMLSGGLDSSSVVSVAQHLARTGAMPHGLAGTITWLDTRDASADEWQYAEAVLRQYGVRNERVVDLDFLHADEDGHGPPPIDQPQYLYPFWARDRRMSEVVRRFGGRTLLTGHAGDQLVAGNMFFFADWIAEGYAWQATREMLRRATLGRVSFWDLAYRNAILPLLPRRLQHALVREQRTPSWIPKAVIKRYGLADQGFAARGYGGRAGHHYADYVALGFTATSAQLGGFSVLGETLELRHPYLFRPLVEHALQLPPEACVQPHARKWVLRQAMRDILPETVRTRVGKGALGAIVGLSLVRKRSEVMHRLRDSILAQLGCIDGRRFQAAVDVAHAHDLETTMSIAATFAIEMWLQVRSGQWYVGERTISNTASLSSINCSHNSISEVEHWR